VREKRRAEGVRARERWMDGWMDGKKRGAGSLSIKKRTKTQKRTPLRDEYLLRFGFLMPLRCALYDWLWAVWFLDLAMAVVWMGEGEREREREGE
jgi:hypothetical protein